MLALGQKQWHLFGYGHMNTWHLHLFIIQHFMVCRKGTSRQKLSVTPRHWLGAQKLCLRGNNCPQRCLEGADKQRDLKASFWQRITKTGKGHSSQLSHRLFVLVFLCHRLALYTHTHTPVGSHVFLKWDCRTGLLNIYSLPKDFIHITDNVTVSPHKGCQQTN